MNIWEYANYSGTVTVVDIDGDEFTGVITDIIAKEDDGSKEDSLILETSNGLISFYASEIKAIN